MVKGAIGMAAQLIERRGGEVELGRELLHQRFTRSSPHRHKKSHVASNLYGMGADRALARRVAARSGPAHKRVRTARAATRIAVAVHDVEPATFESCALIRDWLDDHGVDRVTLLVIPARDLHPLGERSPQMASWLNERARGGDAIAQHGFHHERSRASGFSARAALRPGRGRNAEFLDLDEHEAKRAVDAGWRVLKLAGVEPSGFVAPAYAYTSGLVSALSLRFRWWAGLWRVHDPLQAPGEHARLAPAWGMSSRAPLGRVLSPPLIRLGALLCGDVLRLDVHPSDLQHPRRVMALEWALRHNQRRQAVTYDELLDGEAIALPAAAPPPAPTPAERVAQPL
jgi:predicted deacetylase